MKNLICKFMPLILLRYNSDIAKVYTDFTELSYIEYDIAYVLHESFDHQIFGLVMNLSFHIINHSNSLVIK